MELGVWRLLTEPPTPNAKPFYMRVIKLAVLSFIFLFLLVTIISLFIPSTIHISRATDISCTKNEVKSLLTDPLKWKEWYPGGDTLDILYIAGIPDGIILDSAYGLCIGEVTDSVVNLVEVGRLARTDVKMGLKILSGNDENKVILQWYMDFKLKWYPWEKFKSLFLENIYGPHLEQGLANLKTVCERRRSSIN